MNYCQFTELTKPLKIPKEIFDYWDNNKGKYEIDVLLSNSTYYIDYVNNDIAMFEVVTSLLYNSSLGDKCYIVEYENGNVILSCTEEEFLRRIRLSVFK